MTNIILLSQSIIYNKLVTFLQCMHSYMKGREPEWSNPQIKRGKVSVNAQKSNSYTGTVP